MNTGVCSKTIKEKINKLKIQDYDYSEYGEKGLELEGHTEDFKGNKKEQVI